MKMNISLSKFLPKNRKTRQNILIVFLIVSLLSAFVVFYNSFLRKPPNLPSVEQPRVVSGEPITSSDASKSIIAKLKRNIQEMNNELNNSFYSSLRDFKPSIDASSTPGRTNPFIK